MNVLGIVGSPRGEKGHSFQIVSAILDGARAAGAETEMMDLSREQPQPCIHCGHACFETGECAQEPAATARSKRIEAADALVLAAPVYCWQPCALTVALFDKTRLSTGAWSREGQHGKTALGIAVAGGTGTGVFTALQSIYAWLCAWKYRPMDPVPVTRFNLDRVLAETALLGQALVARATEPYTDVWDLMLTYDRLPFADFGRVDEFRWLAEQIVAGLRQRDSVAAQIAGVQSHLDRGDTCATAGDEAGAAQAFVAAYRLGRDAWEAPRPAG